jgi:RimJ/RimL family protein N-acetyltransferase
MQTERLTLRRFTPADLDQLYELDNDPEVMRYLNGGEPTPREVTEREILPRFLHYDDARPGFGRWAAVETRTGIFLGWFSLLPVDDEPHEAELGYRLRKATWGHGYATEGARALIERGFRELGLRRVLATTYQDNLASRRVMEKCGMRLVRTFRLTEDDLAADTSFHSLSDELWDGDDVEYAVTMDEWESQRRGESLAHVSG